MARRPRKCPILSFTPLRSTQIYYDLENMGFEEVSPLQGEKQGNLRFEHPEIDKAIRINLNGHIWLDTKRPEGSNRSDQNIKKQDGITLPDIKAVENVERGKSIELIMKPGQSDRFFQECLTLADYEVKLEFLFKYLLYRKKIITEQEYFSEKSPYDVITERITTDPASFPKFKNIKIEMFKDPESLYKFITTGTRSVNKLLDWLKTNDAELFKKLIDIEKLSKPAKKAKAKKKDEISPDDEKPEGSNLELGADLGKMGF